MNTQQPEPFDDLQDESSRQRVGALEPVRSLRQLSRTTGVPLTTLQRNTRNAGFPTQRPDGTWDVDAVRHWIASRSKAKTAAKAQRTDLRSEMQEAVLKFRQGRAELLALHVAEKRRELMPVRQHRRLVSDVGCAWARTLRLRSRRLAARLAGQPFEIIKRELDADAEQMLGVFHTADTLEEAVAVVEREEAEAEPQETVA